MRLPLIASTAAFSLCLLTLPLSSQPQSPLRLFTSDSDRAAAHATPDWKLVEPHLPDPDTASAQTLEMQGDLLRVRRFPQDALDYYGYAFKRGGDQAALLNKIGITELELGNRVIARAFFQRVVKMKKNNQMAWNNLGAVDFLDRNYSSAIGNYKHALKIDRHSAISHSNLGMAYVEMKDYSTARKELAVALKLDPQIFTHTSAAGVSLHMLSTEDHASFCFEMAKVYARAGNQEEMIHSLGMASQAGMDVQYEMSKDRDLSPFVHDARVEQLVVLAKSLRATRKTQTTVATALPPAAPAPAAAR